MKQFVELQGFACKLFCLPGNEYYLQQTYEPLFQKYHVDLGLWGHVHQYERTVSISYNGTEVPPGQGTVHVIIGNAGKITTKLPRNICNNFGVNHCHST